MESPEFKSGVAPSHPCRGSSPALREMRRLFHKRIPCYLSFSSPGEPGEKRHPKVALHSCPTSLGQFYATRNLRSWRNGRPFCTPVPTLHLKPCFFDI